MLKILAAVEKRIWNIPGSEFPLPSVSFQKRFSGPFLFDENDEKTGRLRSGVRAGKMLTGSTSVSGRGRTADLRLLFVDPCGYCRSCCLKLDLIVTLSPLVISTLVSHAPYTRGNVVARVAVAETGSRTPLFRKRLWPHVEARSRCSLPQLAVERA
jgi:hypothetical protein